MVVVAFFIIYFEKFEPTVWHLLEESALARNRVQLSRGCTGLSCIAARHRHSRVASQLLLSCNQIQTYAVKPMSFEQEFE